MDLVESLSTRCRVLLDCEDYTRDSAPFCPAGTPAVVALPRTVDQVRHVMRTAHRLGVPVVPQGARTGLAGGANAVDGCVVLSLTRMNRILEIDAPNRLVRCEPGVITKALADAVAEHGLCYPPDPVSRDTCTIGGNIATGAGGLCCVKYGVTADYVRGLTVVLADGRLMRTGGRTVKGVAGLDLTHLLVGSEGTLGVIVEATLALRPARGPSTGLLAQFGSAREAGAAVAAIIAAGHTPSALELIDRTTTSAIHDLGHPIEAAPTLIAESDSEDAAADVAAMEALCRAAGAVHLERSDQALEFRKLIAAAMLAIMAGMGGRPTAFIEDVAVPRTHLAALIEEIETISHHHGLWIGATGHAGDGNLHPIVLFDQDDPDAVKRAEAAYDAIMAAGLDLGGTITGEHGVGVLKRGWLRREVDADNLRMQRGIKRVFDPTGLLNPGKVFDDD